MKKLLILFLILAGCAVQPKDRAIQTIGVGTVANDGTGDKLRNAMIKVNSNFSYHEAQILLRSPILNPVFTGLIKLSTDTIPTYPQVRTEINDTITARLAVATSISTIAPLWTDTVSIVATKRDIRNIVGSGGGSTATIDELEFIIGYTTGAPGVGDSTITHSNFIGKHLEIFRGPSNSATYSGGLRQKENPIGAANPKDGFRKNNTTGQVIFRPVFVDGELVSIESTNTIIHNSLSIEGQESDLLTDLKAYYNMDETAGSDVNDSHGTYDGTTTATVNEAGKFGRAELFTAASNTFVNLGTSVFDFGTEDFTVAAWINIPTLQSAELGIMGSWGTPPYFWFGLISENKLTAAINLGSGNIEVVGNSALSAATWYHVALVATRDGSMVIYVDGVAQTDTDDISAEVAVSLVNNNRHTIGTIGNNLAGYYFDGIIDEVFVSERALSVGEIQDLMTKTYPFN